MTLKTRLYPFIRMALLVLIVLFAFFLQCAGGAAKPDVPVWWLLSAAVCVSIFEYEFSGMMFGLFAGALADFSSSVPDGVWTLFFTVICCAVGLLSRYYMRRTAGTAAFLTAGAGGLFCAVSLILNCLTKDITCIAGLITGFYLPGLVLTVLTAPVVYALVKAAEKLKNA